MYWISVLQKQYVKTCDQNKKVGFFFKRASKAAFIKIPHIPLR